jgi:hypothetical protein
MGFAFYIHVTGRQNQKRMPLRAPVRADPAQGVQFSSQVRKKSCVAQNALE